MYGHASTALFLHSVPGCLFAQGVGRRSPEHGVFSACGALRAQIRLAAELASRPASWEGIMWFAYSLAFQRTAKVGIPQTIFKVIFYNQS